MSSPSPGVIAQKQNQKSGRKGEQGSAANQKKKNERKRIKKSKERNLVTERGDFRSKRLSFLVPCPRFFLLLFVVGFCVFLFMLHFGFGPKSVFHARQILFVCLSHARESVLPFFPFVSFSQQVADATRGREPPHREEHKTSASHKTKKEVPLPGYSFSLLGLFFSFFPEYFFHLFLSVLFPAPAVVSSPHTFSLFLLPVCISP